MCGIFAVLRDPATRVPPASGEVAQALDHAVEAAHGPALVAALRDAATTLAALNHNLKGGPGMQAMVGTAGLVDMVDARVAEVEKRIAEVESDLDAGRLSDDVDLEQLNAALVEVKDATWALRRDRLTAARAVVELLQVEAGASVSPCAVESFASIQLALSAIDRLEVRGRDSAGISVIVSDHELEDADIDQAISDRDDDLFLSGAVHRSGDATIFVYKAAAEIGALGDNIRTIRKQVLEDDLLRRLLSGPNAQAAVLGHTRWASVGTVSEPNAHPVDSTETEPAASSYVVAVLNGDVDNYAALKTQYDMHVAEEITTDTKVIPVLTGRRLAENGNLVESFRQTVSEFEGSVAIGAASAEDPSRMVLAVKGSGQGCYVGFAENAFLVASEPYGLVEECGSYIRLDGETPSPKSGEMGQVVVLSRDGAGTIAGLKRYSYGGEELPVTESELVAPEVTTRDIDRGSATHFLLKEITESPSSVLRTVRGKVVENGGRLEVALPDATLPPVIVKGLQSGTFSRLLVIGQGTAAIAGNSLVTALRSIAPRAIAVEAMPATELSGFNLRDDMSDTLIVAVSQSGTTTDTNRTVDLARSRGAKVIAIVNRRNSDLTDKADGVLYTSDGRDVEMSVASTKAFYAQVAASTLLAIAIAAQLGDYDRQEAEALLKALRALPDAMSELLTRRPAIAAAAQEFAPPKKSWAITGNGANFIAARELRIKLSELCYKSIAYDVTEDKKHIDLSAEPMILVCAAGLTGAAASDIVKEIAIFGAHKASPIVIASDGFAELPGAVAVLSVPRVHPALDFIMSTMAGHLFGYEAALAIDAQGRLMRTARAALDDAVSLVAASDEELLHHIRLAMAEPTAAIIQELRTGRMNGHIEPSTAVGLAVLLRVATGLLPLDVLDVQLGRPISPADMVTELSAALNKAVDELTRPIDAVKHQAKTVTVGISRPEESFLDDRLVVSVVDAGVERERLSYRTLRTLAALSVAVKDVRGFTRYAIDGDVQSGPVNARVVSKGGIAEGISSRVEADGRLTGTKHRAAFERTVTVGRGERDDRSFILVPETQDQHVVGITLLHVGFTPMLEAESARQVLTTYRNRYSAIVDAVTETEPSFDDAILGEVAILDLLTEPVWVLAREWRTAAAED